MKRMYPLDVVVTPTSSRGCRSAEYPHVRQLLPADWAFRRDEFLRAVPAAATAAKVLLGDASERETERQREREREREIDLRERRWWCAQRERERERERDRGGVCSKLSCSMSSETLMEREGESERE
jgi:hypothetical protein